MNKTYFIGRLLHLVHPCKRPSTTINLNGTIFTVADGERLFGRPILGGLDRHGDINSVAADEMGAVIKAAIEACPEGRLMIGAECTVSQAPLENIHAAVYAAHHSGNLHRSVN